jgi:hypothetical protein
VNFYLLDDPANPAEFARFSHLGTWADDGICQVCGVPTSRLIEPLQIEWDEGTERIGDFSWGGYTCVVVDAVKSFLEANNYGTAFGRVKVMAPVEPTVRPRVPFPYRGPHLSWLMPTRQLGIDPDRSGVRLKSDCSACGQRRYTFKRDGLVLPKWSWKGEKLFLVEQFAQSGAAFITEDGLAMLAGAGFSNLCPRIAGLIES